MSVEMVLSNPASAPLAPPVEGDGELVRRAREGDSAAAEELARRYRTAAFLTALQLLRQREDALDVAQDALLRFFTTLHRFDCRRPVRPWLLRIVRNCARDLLRRKRVRRADSLDTGGWEGEALEVADPSPDPAHDAQLHQLQRRVWQALSALSDAHREILVLRDYQDLSYHEIAEVLGIPLGTVMSRLHAARRRLRACIDSRDPTLGGDAP